MPVTVKGSFPSQALSLNYGAHHVRTWSLVMITTASLNPPHTQLIVTSHIKTYIFPRPTTTFSQSVLSLSHVQLFTTSWTAARQTSLSITNSQNLLKLTLIESVMPSNHLILCRPLLLLPSTSPSISIFSNESVLHIRWPKYWSFSFSPSNEYSGLISLRMDWLYLLAV